MDVKKIMASATENTPTLLDVSGFFFAVFMLLYAELEEKVQQDLKKSETFSHASVYYQCKGPEKTL